MKKTHKKIDTFMFECESSAPETTFRFFARQRDGAVLMDALFCENKKIYNVTELEVESQCLDALSETIDAYKLEKCNDSKIIEEVNENEAKWSLEVRYEDETSLLADFEHELFEGAEEGFAELREYLFDYVLWCIEGDEE